MNRYDLLLTGGHLIDPSQKIDSIKDVGFKDGRVVEVSDKLDHALAEKVYNISDNIITPGLIDLHTHIYWGGTSISIEPKDYARVSALIRRWTLAPPEPEILQDFANI